MKNVILKSITCMVFIIFIVSACMLDSASLVPFTVCIVSLCWLVPFGIINHVIEIGGR